MSLCECGCGGYASPGKKFIRGHNVQVNNPMDSIASREKILKTKEINGEIREGKRPAPEPKYCECGCGQLCKIGNRFIKGHNMVGVPGWNKGYTKNTHKGVKKISESHLGKTTYNKGLTKETSESVRRGGEKRAGHTKENDESVRRRAEKMKGRTKENNEGKRRGAEKMTGKEPTQAMIEGRIRQAEKMRGELSAQWQGGISFEPYCYKFNNLFKEEIRNKYNRICFLCSMIEEEQKDDLRRRGKTPKRLAVHHVNYNKNCLCDESDCEFVPLCSSCHAKIGFNQEYWEKVINDKLNNNEVYLYNKINKIGV